MPETQKSSLFRSIRLGAAACCAWAVFSAAPALSQTIIDPPHLVSPPNGIILQYHGEDFAIDLKWDAVANAESYQVNYALNRIPNRAETQNTHFTLTFPASSFTAPTSIVWSVQTKIGGKLSAPSSIYSFSIEANKGTPLPEFLPTPTPLPAPDLLAPLNGTIISEEQLGQEISFEWTPVTGAASYDLIIYDENKPFLARNAAQNEILIRLGGVDPLQKIYQWQVRTLDEDGRQGAWSPRSWFQIGTGVFPTPTPAPRSYDLNGDGAVAKEDLFLLATRYQLNDPSADYNNNGLIDGDDVIRFLSGYHPSLIPLPAN